MVRDSDTRLRPLTPADTPTSLRSVLFWFRQNLQRTIQCLQDQLQLLDVHTQAQYVDLRSASAALHTPLEKLQEDISR